MASIVRTLMKVKYLKMKYVEIWFKTLRHVVLRFPQIKNVNTVRSYLLFSPSTMPVTSSCENLGTHSVVWKEILIHRAKVVPLYKMHYVK